MKIVCFVENLGRELERLRRQIFYPFLKINVLFRDQKERVSRLRLVMEITLLELVVEVCGDDELLSESSCVE